MPINYYICSCQNPNLGMPYLDKERKTSSDKLFLAGLSIAYLIVSVVVTYKKVMIHKNSTNRVCEIAKHTTGKILTVCGSGKRRFERQDEVHPHKKDLEIFLLVCKMSLFSIANYILQRFNEHRPEDLMQYPGIVYCLLVQFGISPTLYGIIVGVRYFRSGSLRDYAMRKLKDAVRANYRFNPEAISELPG